MEVIDETREEPEKRFLLECGTLFFVQVGQNEDKDGQYLRQVVNLGLVIVDSRSVAMVLDNVHNEPRHSVQSLEGVGKVVGGDALDVAVDAGLRTDSEEEGRRILDFQNALLRQLCDEGHKAFLGGVGALEDIDPLLEPNEKLLAHLLSLRFN